MGFEAGKPTNVKVRPPKKKTPKVKPPVSPDRVDRARGMGPEAISKATSKNPPTPDQADRERAPQQKKRDAQVVAQNVASSRRKVVIKRRQEDAAAYPKTVLTGGNTPSEQRRIDALPQATKDAIGSYQTRVRSQQAAKLAPVLKVLDQTTRPIHAIAGATDAVITHKPILRAAQRGIENKDRTTFSDVLGHAGVKNKTIKGIVGTGLDVGLDPTTYLTGGTGSIATKAAEKEGARAAAEATAKGLTKKEVKKAASTASKVAYKGAELKGSGVTVKIAGKEVPGVRRGTAAVGRGGGKVLKKAVPEKTRNTARAIAADVNPNVAPVGVAKDVNRKAIQATRAARGKVNAGNRSAIDLAHGIRRQIGEKNYAQVTDAIEAGDLTTLPHTLVPHAQTLREHLADVRKAQRKAGVKVPERKGYIPRKLTSEAVEAENKKAAAVGGRGSVSPRSSLARKEQRTMAELRTQEPGRYRQDLHALVGERVAEGHASAARAELAQRIAKLGRPTERGTKPALKDGEGVYQLKPGKDLQPIDTNSKKFRTTAGPNPKTKYVILNHDVVKRAQEGAAPSLAGPGIVHSLDKATGLFKRTAIATPGFHVRNFVGDTNQAYINQPGRKLVTNMVRAKRVTKVMADAQKSARDLKPPAPSGKTLRTARYGHVALEDIADKLVKAGAARSGYTARELTELGASGGAKRVGKVRGGLRKGSQAVGQTRGGQAVKRAGLTREDLPRIATAIHALQNGATWEEAAQKVADTHFDYAHLTSFERNIARRVMPFYTWSSRNLPFQAKNVIKNPGKYAAYQKVREEATKATQPGQVDQPTKDLYKQLEAAGVALPGGWEKYLSSYEQRNAGIPVSVGGRKFTVSGGLPLTDLNEFPGAALSSQIDEYYQKGMSLTGPLPKDLVEYMDNHSFFFRDQLERDNSPLVAAPSWADKLPPQFKKWADVGPIVDKRTGKKVLGWRGKADYVFSTIPGTPQYLKQFTTQGTNQQGKGTGGKFLGYMGIKATPVDPVKNATNLAYARQAEIQKQLAALHQQGVNKTNSTAEWRKLNDQLKIVTQIAYQGKVAQGYKVLPTSGGPPKPKGSSGFNFDSGQGEFDFSQGSQGFDFN